MPIDRAALKARMKEVRAQERKATKQIGFPLPDPRTPDWNAFALNARADLLMANMGISEATRAEFAVQAREALNFHDVLNNLGTWFTLTVRSTEYIPLVMPVTDYYDQMVGDQERENDDEVLDAQETEALDKIDSKVEGYKERAEREKVAAEFVRQQLGLADDELVIVQIVKKG